MKHTKKVTYILVGFFLISQFIGLVVVDRYLDHKTLDETGEIEYNDLPFDIERPPIEEGMSVWYIAGAIVIGTIILLIIIKFRGIRIWKTWYFLSVLITMTVALGGFFNQIVAIVLSALGAFYKIFRPKVWIHNVTELFIYGGLAAIFVPIMNLFSAVTLLILISIYDMYAVWKSKHMVKLAEFTTESRVFAGLSVPYDKKSGKISGSIPKSSKLTSKKSRVRHAILGGGDIGFPLMFAGVVMKDIMLNNGLLIGFAKAMIIPVFTTIALYLLFVKGDKNKFYPAMPFLSAGCFVGYGVLLLVGI
jgi:presenilin-like A22 family membrane protease